MRIEYRKIGQLFYAGLAFTLMSTAIYSLTIFEPEVPTPTLITLTLTLNLALASTRSPSSSPRYPPQP